MKLFLKGIYRTVSKEMGKTVSLILLVLIFSPGMHAQVSPASTNNMLPAYSHPDSSNHLKTGNRDTSPAIHPGSGTNASATVAFDSTRKPQSPKENVKDARRIFPVFRNAINKYQPFYFFMFIGGFIMLAVIRIINPPYLKNLLASTFNLKLLMHLFKEGIFGFNIINLLLDILCVAMLSIGVQIYFFVKEPTYFLWILSFITIAYVIKLIAIQLLANIFLGKAEALIHLLLHLLLTRFMGLILLPVLFITLYQPVFDVNAILRILIYCLGVFYAAWMLRLYVQMKSMSTSGMIYLFLYLCTIEISPLVILLKVSIR